jgi:hypothetical protein
MTRSRRGAALLAALTSLLIAVSGLAAGSPAGAAGPKPGPHGAALKGAMPTSQAAASRALRAPCTGTCYTYAGRSQSVVSDGSVANLRIESPYCSSTCYHSLAEIAVQDTSSASTRNVAEIGWTHDPTVCAGVTGNLCLFVFNWVGGVGKVYNLATGSTFVENTTWCSTAGAICAGDAVPTGVAKSFAIQHFGSGCGCTTGWWAYYDGHAIGVYPDSTWTSAGITFTQTGLIQWFGELAHSTTVPCSDVGQGTFGSTGALPATYFGSISLYNGASSVSPSTVVTNSSWYDVGVASAQTFYFGGPGANGVVGGC